MIVKLKDMGVNLDTTTYIEVKKAKKAGTEEKELRSVHGTHLVTGFREIKHKAMPNSIVLHFTNDEIIVVEDMTEDEFVKICNKE